MILPFKKTEVKLRDSLDKRVGILDKLYDGVDKLVAAMGALEERISLEEEYYDAELLDYSEKVGADSVELKYFEYSSNILVTETPAGFQLVWVDPDNPEQEFVVTIEKEEDE
jgi:hypothetical protein